MEGIEPVLYRDPQVERRVCLCPVCGRERYAPGYRCIYCERRCRP